MVIIWGILLWGSREAEIGLIGKQLNGSLFLLTDLSYIAISSAESVLSHHTTDLNLIYA